MGRRFVTKADIDALADAGYTELDVDDTVTVTDVAQERALERGVRIVRTAGPSAAPTPGAAGNAGAGAASGAADDARAGAAPGQVRAEVRRAVIARLGREPADLDRVIARVMGRLDG
jgi:hypothetical protein